MTDSRAPLWHAWRREGPHDRTRQGNDRLARDWSQEALAERLHVTRQTVSNWERGKTLVDVRSLAAMAARA
ncbi:MAG: helix-turn-helix transcriptional regulator [Atopobiaceae bacterium]|nr:helix-turn-helix transcriptional regulator [Atopobiaceae bacterium]